jgi:hypothetical protein
MKTMYIELSSSGAMLHFASNRPSGMVITVPDDVWVTSMPVLPEMVPPRAERSPAVGSTTGFPPRDLTEAAIVQIIREHGGTVKIRQNDWNIYDELAARLGVSIDARRRLTAGTNEPAWRPEVGFARKNLEQRGELAPTAVSGRGVWQLARTS